MHIPYFAAAALLLPLLSAGVAGSQPFPSKTIRIVTSDAGGGNDFTARLIAQGLIAGIGQQVIVENRPAGVIPGEIVAKARPDGYSLLVYGNNLWIGPYLQKTPYDPPKDFSPITLISRAPNVLVVHPSLPVKSVKDLIALAKARPGELNYASGSNGSSSHLAAELFKHMAGISMVWIPYRGAGPANTALLGGQVQLMFGTATAVTAHARSGKLRALAVTSAQPSPLLPELPTIAASGLPGYETVAMYGLFAPAGTPAAIVDRLNQETVKALNTPATKEKFLSSGVEIVGSSPQEFATIITSDTARLSKVIKAAGIRVD